MFMSLSCHLQNKTFQIIQVDFCSFNHIHVPVEGKLNRLNYPPRAHTTFHNGERNRKIEPEKGVVFSAAS